MTEKKEDSGRDKARALLFEQRNRLWMKYLGDVDDEYKLDFIAGLPANAALNVLKKILQSLIDKAEVDKTSSKLYKDPNWALHQADYIGTKRALISIIKLLP